MAGAQGARGRDRDPRAARLELRANLSVYDASYVALAELAGATLVTLDRRIGGAPGLHCSVATPGA